MTLNVSNYSSLSVNDFTLNVCHLLFLSILFGFAQLLWQETVKLSFLNYLVSLKINLTGATICSGTNSVHKLLSVFTI